MALPKENGPSDDGRSDALRVLRPVLAVLAACVIAFCGWSVWEYSQGADPLALLDGAFQTVEEGSADQGAIELAPSDDAASQEGEAADEQDGEPAEDAQPEEGQTASDASSDAGAASGSAAAPSATSGSAGAGSSDGSGGGSSTSAPSGGHTSGSGSGSGNSASGGSSSGSASSGSSDAGTSRPARITVSITVDGSKAGAGSSSATLSLAPGSTVYDALASCGVSYNAKSTGYGMYVSSIGGLAEKEHGGMSGWLYSVNGVVPNYACSSYQLSDGDSVYWWYDNVEY